MTCPRILVTIFSLIVTASASLEPVSDTELEKLISNEKFVVTLFRDETCKSCDEVESQLSSIREDLVDTLNAWVVKSVGSPLASNFTTGKDSTKPLVVYFRHSVPMLYDGPINDEAILETFVQNKESGVNHLNDDSFEHLTQAASGATTGDWFVFFFRQGKIYQYDLPNLDSKAFQDFALGWYKNVPSKNVPSPKTPFDELVDRVVFTLKENPWILPAAGATLLLVVILVGMSWLKSSKPKKTTKSKKSVKKSE
uniref:EOG090X0856 n=1 Tax=Scapholeberis mucronata TaxID=202097 RepID=A0A4Y7NKE2_9CRUS|nr:EOG090X0856 [Scapholeberis mucronata]SVE93690.1 EOG090X0856 [Scapholeberis mucronata]